MLDTDKYLVQRGTESFNVSKEDTKFIAPDDLLLVNRDGVNYSITGAIFMEEGGGGEVDNPDQLEPDENSSTIPGYAGGTGTLEDPFILTSEPCYLAGTAVSNQIITIFGMEEGLSLQIVDTDAATNGVKFLQPTLTANKAGYVMFQMVYNDVPSTDGGGSASALLNIGEIYWSWDVTISSKGISKPSIQEIIGKDGNYYTPIYGPDFTPTLQEANEIISETISDLTPDQTLENVPTVTVTGIGTGLTLNILTDEDGYSKYFFIQDAGTDYAFGDQVTVDLTSIGGSSETPLTVYTAPVSAPSITFKITEFSSVEAGDFLKQEWYIGTEPDFRNPDNYDIYDITDNTTNPTVTTNLPTGSTYYAKARFVSNQQIYSGWSDVVKAGIIDSYKNFSYTISNLSLNMDGGGNYVSFISPEINVPKTPGTYFTHVTQTTGLCKSQPKAPDGSGGGRNCGGGYGSGNDAEAIIIQVRNDLQLEVTSVDDIGAVLSISQSNFPVGLSDYFLNKDVETTTTGSGTGYRPVINRVNSLTTWMSTFVRGTGYAKGDIIKFVSPLGNGANGQEAVDVSAINVGITDINVSHNTNTVDSEHDVLIQGIGESSGGGTSGSCNASGGGGGPAAHLWIGSREGPGGGGASDDGYTPGPNPTNPATISNDFYIERGGGASTGNRGDCCYGAGGAGGAGWGMGLTGLNGRGEAERRTGGSGGSSGYSKVNPIYIPDPVACGSQATFSTKGTYLYVGGSEITVGQNYYYRIY